jgi:hypothetical protein
VKLPQERQEDSSAPKTVEYSAVMLVVEGEWATLMPLEWDSYSVSLVRLVVEGEWATLMPLEWDSYSVLLVVKTAPRLFDRDVLVPLVRVLFVPGQEVLVSPLVQGHENYYYQHLQVDSLFAVRFVA